MLTLLIIILLFIVLIVEIFTPFFVSIIAPGFVNDLNKFNLAVEFTRITFPFLLFISLASFFSGILLDTLFMQAMVPSCQHCVQPYEQMDGIRARPFNKVRDKRLL